MSAIFEGRSSDSPYIHMIWRGRVKQDYMPLCAADTRWNLLLVKHQDRVRVTVEGPTTQAVTKTNLEGQEFLVIKFDLGIYLPVIPVKDLINGDALLPEAASKSFWLDGESWQFPDFENAENFVDKLVRHDVIRFDPVVSAVLQEQTTDWSFRTVRRRFLNATGLTHKSIQQIERAHQAAALLGQGTPILDAVYQLGYADQPHLTRSLKRFYGQTPAQIARVTTSASG
jgi:AraC-like DNA-binding protein